MRNPNIVCLPILPSEYVWKKDTLYDGEKYSFDIYQQYIANVDDEQYHHTEPDGSKYMLFAWTPFVYRPEACTGFYTLTTLDLDEDASSIETEGGMQACLDLMAARV